MEKIIKKQKKVITTDSKWNCDKYPYPVHWQTTVCKGDVLMDYMTGKDFFCRNYNILAK